jgi:hypothetical protein
VDYFSVPRRLVAQSLAREPDAPWLSYFLSLVDFRAGRYQGAIEYLGGSLKLSSGWASAPLNHPVLAMAHHRLGHRDEARRWPEKAHGREREEAIPSYGAYWDKLEFQLLLREAEALVLDAGPVRTLIDHDAGNSTPIIPVFRVPR